MNWRIPHANWDRVGKNHFGQEYKYGGRYLQRVVAQSLNNHKRWIFLSQQVIRHEVKGLQPKNLSKRNLVFVISQLIRHQHLQILSLPHIITRVLCWVGKIIFKFRCCMSWEIVKTKFHLLSFLFVHPLHITIVSVWKNMQYMKEFIIEGLLTLSIWQHVC